LHHRTIAYIHLILLVALALSACQSVAVTPTPPPSASPTVTPPPATAALTPTTTPTAAPTATGSAAAPAPLQGGTANLGLVGRPPSLNPITDPGPLLQHLAPLLFDTLLRVDPQTARLQPGLAQSWRYSDDGRQVTFQLPPGLKWSDGSPLTAPAIGDSLQATQHPALLSFSQISAPDDQTLRLTFTGIDCAAVTALGLLPILPADQIIEPLPLGSGPFSVADWSDDRRTLQLMRNPHFSGQSPFLDGLTVRFIGPDELAIALSEGQFDAVGPLLAPLPPVVPGSFTRLSYPAAQISYIAINFDPKNEPPLSPQIRQALAQALDRETILAEALQGEGQLVAGSLLAGHWAANGSLSPPAYNPQAARTLLVQAGLTDSNGDGWLELNGDRLELGLRLNGKNRLHQRLGWLISSYYRDLGLYVRAETVPPDSLIDDLFTHDFRLALFSWPILPDPDQRPYWHSDESEVGEGLNFVSYSSPQLDEILAQGVSVPGCQPQQRAEFYRQAQQLLSQQRPVDFLLAPNQHVLVGPRLAGVAAGPFAPFTQTIIDWQVQP